MYLYNFKHVFIVERVWIVRMVPTSGAGDWEEKDRKRSGVRREEGDQRSEIRIRKSECGSGNGLECGRIDDRRQTERCREAIRR